MYKTALRPFLTVLISFPEKLPFPGWAKIRLEKSPAVLTLNRICHVYYEERFGECSRQFPEPCTNKRTDIKEHTLTITSFVRPSADTENRRQEGEKFKQLKRVSLAPAVVSSGSRVRFCVAESAGLRVCQHALQAAARFRFFLSLFLSCGPHVARFHRHVVRRGAHRVPGG